MFTCKIAAIPIWFELRFSSLFFVSQNRIHFACVCVTRVRVCVGALFERHFECDRWLPAEVAIVVAVARVAVA